MDFDKGIEAVEFIASQRETEGNGLYLAHLLARRGYIFPLDSSLLYLATNSDWTVAHEMARCGHNFPDGPILDFVDNAGVTVADLM